MENTDNTLLVQGKQAWLGEITLAANGERTQALAQVATCAFYAFYNNTDAQKELFNHFISLGYTKLVRGSEVHVSNTKRAVVNAALALVEKERPALRAILEACTPDDEGRAIATSESIALIQRNYTVDGLPLNVSNIFLPMLTKDWSAEELRSACTGKASPEASPASVAAEAEAIVASAEAQANAKEEKPYSEKLWNAAKTLFSLLSDIPAKDDAAQLAAVEILHTSAMAVMLAEGVYTLTRQDDGREISLGFADAPIAEGIAKEYSRATSGMAVIKGEAQRVAVLEGIAALEEKHAKPEGKKRQKAA